MIFIGEEGAMDVTNKFNRLKWHLDQLAFVLPKYRQYGANVLQKDAKFFYRLTNSSRNFDVLKPAS